MRLPLASILCPALLVLTACDGGLGGNIHDQPRILTAADLETRPERTASAPRAERPDRPEVEQPEEVEEVQAAPTEEPTPVADSKPTPPKRTGRSRPGKKGSHSGVITVVEAGAAAAGTIGQITGTVLFVGTPPTRRPLTKIAETQGCHDHEQTPLTEDVVVNDGKLQHVFIYLKSIPDGVTIPPPPTEPLVLNQVGCTYVPHVAGIQVGRSLQAGNGDDAPHNVNMSAIRNKGDNKVIAAGSPPMTLPTPTAEEIPINFGCDIHTWMKAKLCVVEHPWFDVSAADGTFTIPGVPPGTYKIEAWQEKYGKARVSGELVVGPGGHVRVDFTYKP